MRIITLIILFFIAQHGFALQLPPQKEMDLRLQEYYAKSIPLKIHLFLNQPRYRAGDTVYYKATAVYAESLKNLNKTNLLNTLLIDQRQQIVVSDKVRLKEGHAANQFAIPASAAPGKYLLVAYHDWMKDASPDLYYQQYIEVAGEKKWEQQPETIPLTFFPEGGQLISGVNNKVVVRGTPGTPGRIKDQSGREVASFAINAEGLGFFYLKPEGGQQYLVEGSGVSLPEPVSSGVAVLASFENEEKRLRVIVQPSPGTTSGKMRLVVDAQGAIHYSATATIKGEYALINIPMEILPAGIARLTVLSEEGNILAERLFFVNNLPEITTTVTLPEKEWSTREKVTFTIKVKEEGADAARSRVAVTVFDKTLHENELGANAYIPGYLYLFSDVQGTALNYNLSFKPDSAAWLKNIDNFLITQSASRAPWSKVMETEPWPLHYANFLLSGKIVDRTTNEPVLDSTFITLFAQRNATAYEARAVQGKFSIPLLIDFFGEEEFYYRTVSGGKILTNTKIILDQEKFTARPWNTPVASKKTDPYFDYSTKQRMIEGAFNFFGKKSDYKKVPAVHEVLEEEFFGADIDIDLDKYIIFPTMEEVIREIIPFVQHRRVKDRSVVRIYFDDIELLAKEDPLYVIDGVFTDDTDFFMQLKPSEVARIKVIKSTDKKYVFGAIGEGGVILVETKIPGHAAKVPRSQNSFKIRGMTESSPVTTFNPNTLSPHVPDLRTNICWAPSLVTNEKGEVIVSFYTSDVTGDFQVRVQGVTANGVPFYRKESFKVQFKPLSN